MLRPVVLFGLLIGRILRANSFAAESLTSFGLGNQHKVYRQRSSLGHACFPTPRMANVVDAEFSYDEVDDGNKQERAKTLVDLSLDSDPEMKDVLVEFVEFLPSGNQKFIDCKLPFTVDLDGVTYAVGTPNDAMVAVITDDENGETITLDADDDSKEEIFQIAAAALVKYIGEDLRLKRTPRILTVEGNLNSYTDKWTQEERVSTEDLLMTEEENDQFLDDFFRDELGPNYEEEFLVNEQSNEKAQKLMDLFNVPGLGTEKDDDEGIRKMFDEMVSGIDISSDEVDNTKALPLFPFTGPDDKTYALVQITHPMLLIGKEDPSIENSQRLLLNIEESAQILPQVRSEFREIMERNDLLE